MMSCAQFARHLERAAIRARNELDIPTEAVMVVVEAQAREVIGTYRLGWQELAAATQADRVAKGYPADEPLLRTGQLAASIEHKAELAPGGAEGLVYSEDKIALYQEIGTSRIPPRSFLYHTLVNSTPTISSAFGKFAIQILTGT